MGDVIELLKALKDPALMICAVVIVFMYRLLVQKDRDLMAVHNTCSLNDRESTETLARLVALVEVMVHGRHP